MEPEPRPQEIEDVSSEYLRIFVNRDPDNKTPQMVEWVKLRRSTDSKPIRLVVDYSTLDDAKRLKGWLESRGGQFTTDFSIRATEEQRREAANVFASGINYLPAEK